MIDFVTTFNEDIFYKYGKNIIDTFIEKSNNEIRLNIFMKAILQKLKVNMLSIIAKLDFLNLIQMIGTFFLINLVT